MSFIREPDSEPIPGYRLIEPLGHGGFGEVWKCVAPGGLFKAIKFVYGNLNSLDVEGARAEQELKALQRIKEVRHPFVLSLDRIEVVGGELAIVMELADSSLHDSFVECQAAGLIGIPRDLLLRYVRDAAEALDHMNEKHNLQHLDVKGRNLFLVSDRVKVADFGLVKHLERASGSGMLGAVTPLYAAPETFSGNISDRTDQYSLAIVYQELLTGQRPFNGKNARQLAQQHMHEEPELRSLAESERPVVARALAKDPAKRFPTCLAFVRALYASSMGRSHDAGHGGNGTNGNGRHKTLTDTLENILLEQDEEPEYVDPAEEVELDARTPDAESSNESVSQLGMTVARPESGALRPTLIVGVGSLGRLALTELRCRFLDRFGDLGKLPVIRFLYIDPDGDAVKAALRGSTDVAFKPGEVYHLPLQAVNHYRRRQLDQLSDWLPREKLYAMPRSLKTQGSRALGRLAFADNYLRLLARLKREVQQATHPDALYQAVSQTGLALRDSQPRVYIVGAATGGASGFLVDLGYTVRRMLQQLHHAETPVTALLFCGAPQDPATVKGELANCFATLMEINHFYDPSLPFTAQYGADGPRLVENGPPFQATYVLTIANRTPEARRDAVAHLGSYLFHELTTPLGLRLERAREVSEPEAAAPFRSFGTYGVWFPRGLLLRLAARRACLKLMHEWQATGESTAQAEVQAACARILADPGLRADALAGRIEESAATFLEGAPGELLSNLLAGLEEQAQQYVAQDDPGSWAKQALGRIHEWLGFGVGSGRDGTTGEWRKSRLTRALENAAQSLAAEWSKKLADVALELTEHPGRRLAAAEAALKQFQQFCDELAEAHTQQREQQATRVQQAQTHLEEALAGCLVGTNGGWGSLFFGVRPRRSLRVFVDHLAAFARQCLAEDLTAAVQQFFGYLNGRLRERLNDLGFCRQRLRHLEQALEAGLVDVQEIGENADDEAAQGPSPLPTTEAFWETIQQSRTARVVLPDAETDLERAALKFIHTLTAEQWQQLDQVVQDKVLAPLGGLQRTCLGSIDLAKGLALPLLDQTATCLGQHLPVTDVAQVVCADAESGQRDLGERLKGYFARAVPQVTAADGCGQCSFVLLPASEAGKEFGEKAQEVIPELALVRVPGQADLMFCREQAVFGAETLRTVLEPMRAAYDQLATTPQTSPHARFDILDWTPLDP